MHLLVYPEGGLCNRMRVVASALSFARRHPAVNCRVLWRRDAACGAWFDELFVSLDEARFHVVRAARWQQPALMRLWPGRKVALNFNRSGRDDLAALCASAPTVYVASCYQLCDYSELPMRSVFRPQPPLAAAIARTVAGLARPVAGVHIRRGDHRASIAHSPTAAFEALLQRLQGEQSYAAVYLSTDDEALRRRLLASYAPLLTVGPGSEAAVRSRLAGMQQAVTDLYVLAHTDHIYGSWGSSFTATAAELQDATLTVVE